MGIQVWVVYILYISTNLLYRFYIQSQKVSPILAQLRLKEAEEARSLCVAIETLECSGELVTALTQHSSSMTDLYRQLNKLTTDNVDDIDVYQPLFDKAVQFSAWYAKRKKVANSMKQAASTS